MRKNKKADITPFDMRRKPRKPSLLLLPLMWASSFFATLGGRPKIRKIGMRGLKPPYLVLSMHQGFTDYFLTPLALFPHRASYVSDVEGFANYGIRLYGALGCIATRRFVGDISTIQNICHAAAINRDIVVVFPEARHSNVGTNTPLPNSVGKLIRHLQLPVVVQKLNGSYLVCPIWDEKHARRAPLEVTLEKIWGPADTDGLDAQELTALVNRHFAYDEYRWQRENGISISYARRAEGLHKMLYLCPHCGVEYAMTSRGHTLICGACRKIWEMDELGRLRACEGATEFPHIPDWYEFQRADAAKQIERGGYSVKSDVLIDALFSEKGFVHLGEGVLRHDADGFSLKISSTGEVKSFRSASMASLHTEYDYRDMGDCAVLSTHSCCYYLHAKGEAPFPVTKMQLAAEEAHKLGPSLRRK